MLSTTASYGFSGRSRFGKTGYSGEATNFIPAATEITPEQAGWRHVGFRALRLRAGEREALETGARELCVVVLSGTVDVRVGDVTHAGQPIGRLQNSVTDAVRLLARRASSGQRPPPRPKRHNLRTSHLLLVPLSNLSPLLRANANLVAPCFSMEAIRVIC